VEIGYIRYNPFHRGAEQEVFPQAAARAPTLLYNFKNVALLSPEEYEALGLTPAHWRPSAGHCYRFVLMRPELDGVLCSFSTPAHVTELVDAMSAGALTDEEHVYMCDLADLAKGEAELEPR
jgi:hypothetical protein